MRIARAESEKSEPCPEEEEAKGAVGGSRLDELISASICLVDAALEYVEWASMDSGREWLRKWCEKKVRRCRK
jgi:hypothetical protein